jgi:hypothetical protein
MSRIIEIINEEIMSTVANYPLFGDHLRSISETGEGSSRAYPFTFDNVSYDEVNYHFDTEQNDYVVVINNVDVHAGAWEMQFGTVGGTPQDVTNEGRPFNVMATILQITNDFINKLKPNILRFKPEKDPEREDDKRRFNLYMQFIKKNIPPEYFVFEYGDYIVIERKVKIKSNIPKI